MQKWDVNVIKCKHLQRAIRFLRPLQEAQVAKKQGSNVGPDTDVLQVSRTWFRILSMKRRTRVLT